MAKNISKNQWFKDIIDDVYLNTAVINNILFVNVVPTATSNIQVGTEIAKLRNPSLVVPLNAFHGINMQIKNNKLIATVAFKTTQGFAFTGLRNKQLETDFYSPEQLAEMYPDDPAYQVATDETKPVVDPVEDIGVT